MSGRLLLAIQLAAILMLPASADDLNEVVAMRNCPGWATAGFGEKILWTGEAGSDSSIG